MRDAARYWDRRAVAYAARPIADEAAHRLKLEITDRYLRPGMEVLDLGCGTGTAALHHATRVGHVRALDISERMLRIARDRARAAGVGNVSFEQADAARFEAQAGSCDAVLALGLLPLVRDRPALLARIGRAMRPGGVFVSSTACLGDHARWMRPLAGAGRVLGVLPEVHVFTANTLRAEIRAAGFGIEEEYQPGRRAALFLLALRAAG